MGNPHEESLPEATQQEVEEAIAALEADDEDGPES